MKMIVKENEIDIKKNGNNNKKLNDIEQTRLQLY